MNYNKFNTKHITASQNFTTNTNIDIGQNYVYDNGSLLLVYIKNSNGLNILEKNIDYIEVPNADTTNKESSNIKLLSTGSFSSGIQKGDIIISIVNQGFEEEDTNSIKIKEKNNKEYLYQNEKDVTSTVKSILNANTETPGVIESNNGTYVELRTTSNTTLYPKTNAVYVDIKDNNKVLYKESKNIELQELMDNYVLPRVSKIDSMNSKLDDLNFKGGEQDKRSNSNIFLSNFVVNTNIPAFYINGNIQTSSMTPEIVSNSQGIVYGSITEWASDNLQNLYNSNFGAIVDSILDTSGNAIYLSESGLIITVSSDDLTVKLDTSLVSVDTNILDSNDKCRSIIINGDTTLVFTNTGKVITKTSSTSWSYININKPSFDIGCAYYNSTNSTYIILPSTSNPEKIGYYATEPKSSTGWTACTMPNESLTNIKGFTNIIKFGNYLLANTPNISGNTQYIYSANGKDWYMNSIPEENTDSSPASITNFVVYDNKVYVGTSKGNIFYTSDVTSFSDQNKKTTGVTNLKTGFGNKDIIGFISSSDNLLMTYSNNGTTFKSGDSVKITGSTTNITSGYFQYINSSFINIVPEKYLNRCQYYTEETYTATIYPWKSNMFILDLSDKYSSNVNIQLEKIAETSAEHTDKENQIHFGDTLILSLVIINGSKNTIKFPGNIYWENGTIPSLSEKVLMTLLTYDSGNSWIITALTDLNQSKS